MSWTSANSGEFLPLNKIFANSLSITHSASGGVFIPYDNLPSTTGVNDFREFVYSVLDKSYEYIVDANADLVAAGSGTIANLTISRSVDSSNILAATPTISKSYSVSSTLNVVGATYDVAEE